MYFRQQEPEDLFETEHLLFCFFLTVLLCLLYIECSDFNTFILSRVFFM